MNGDDINIIPMPYITTSGSRKKINKIEVDQIFESFKDEEHFLVIEIQQAMRKPMFRIVENTNERIMLDSGDVQGTSSSFNTGYGFGVLVGLATAHKLQYLCVAAQKWQKHIFPDVRSQGSKATSIARAKELYPHISLKIDPDNKRERTDKHGKSDALLIAHYAMLFHQAGNGRILYEPGT